MKKFLLLVGGIVLGVVITLVIMKINNRSQKIIFKKPIEYETNMLGSLSDKETETDKSKQSIGFKVFQVLDSGDALAQEVLFVIPTGRIVLLASYKDKPYYDNQVVSIPEGCTIKQIGTFKYVSTDETERTVPIIDFFVEEEI